MMKRKANVLTGLIAVVALCGVTMSASAQVPPLSSWADCPASYTTSAARFGTPLPIFTLGTVGSPVTSWPAVGSYNFCHYMDTVYCQLKYINSVVDVSEYADLLRCLDADINGPVDLLLDPPIQGNGMTDGQYEFMLLAYVLNTPEHPLHADAHAAIRTNFVFFKDLIQLALTDVDGTNYLALVPLMVPHLIGALAMQLAGYAALDDPLTYDALDALLALLTEIGLSPPPGGVISVTDGIGDVGPGSDFDADGFSNIDEYLHVEDTFGITISGYDGYVKNPATATIAGAKYYMVGTRISLSPSLIYGGVIEGASWEKDSTPLGTAIPLVIPNCQYTDAGEYTVTVTHRMGATKGTSQTVGTGTVTVGDIPIPVTGIAGIAALSGAIALLAARRLRRRK